jgi:PAS domain-containing protein
MVLQLAAALDVPLRERNALLLAAGFAPLYKESTLDTPELRAVRRALDAILAKQEPYPAVVMNRHWDIVQANGAAARFFGFLLGPDRAAEPANVLRLMFHPDGLRPFVKNWEAVGEALVQRVLREAVGRAPDQELRRLLAEILGYPGVPRAWSTGAGSARFLPVVPVSFQKGDRRFDFFSTVTTLGTPQDVTLQEIRIECFFPADVATAEAARRPGAYLPGN